MEIKLIVSGVPNGEHKWGAGIHEQYIGTLYTNTDKSVNKRFDICINKTNGKYYAYYHYMICNVVSDYNGRAGSYLCLTLCLDKFFKDYRTVYSVLDLLFRKQIEGKILQSASQSDRYTYKFASFSECNDILKDIEKQAIEIIGQNASHAEFSDLTNNIPHGVRNKINTEDATPAIVLKSIVSNGSCSISSEYPRNKDSEWEKTVKDAEHRGAMSRQNEIDELVKNKRDNEKVIGDTQRRNQELSHENSRLKTDNSTLTKKIEKYDRTKRISEIVEPIIDPINQLSDYFKAPKEKKSLSSYLLGAFKVLVLCFVLFCITYNTYEICKVKTSVEAFEGKLESILPNDTVDTDSTTQDKDTVSNKNDFKSSESKE